MPDIVTLTLNPAVDVATTVERVVDTHKLRCAPARRDPGGGGINVARVIHRLGGDCVALYAAGGLTGRMLSASLAAEGLPAECVEIAGETRENFSVRETSTGREFRFVLPGPSLSEAEWRRFAAYLERDGTPPRYVVLSGSLPPGLPAKAYADLTRWANLRGTRVVLDTSGPPLALALDAGVFLVKPSLGELAAIVEKPLADEAAWLAAARSLVDDRRAQIVALTLGERGALVVTAEEILRVPALEVPISSATGAGDSFLAGLLVALRRGQTLRDAARLAQAAASATLLSSGTALCDAQEVKRLYAGTQEVV